MNKTIQYYKDHAKEYASSTIDADMSFHYEHFLKYLPIGSTILDAGCGSGRDSKFFYSHGYSIHAFDASKEMADIAAEYLGIPVDVCTYETMDYYHQFDGIWSCASLLHVAKECIPNVAKRLYDSLKEDGILYISMKYGNNETEDEKGRYFNYIDESFGDIFLQTGFSLMELYKTTDVRNGREDTIWLNFIWRKHKKES